MGGKIHFSSRKELRRKARKRQELRQYKDQTQDDSVIYCDRVTTKRPSTAKRPTNASKTVSKDIKPKTRFLERRKARRSEPKSDKQENSELKYENLHEKHFSEGSGNTTDVSHRNSQGNTLSKTQKKLQNPRRIVGVTNGQWGHLQGLQFALKTLNRTTLIIFDPCGNDNKHTTESNEAMSTTPPLIM